MSQRITIEIKDKIATCLTESPLVCGNADYVVDFVFDEEWEKHEVKTAMFIVNGKATPQVFAGTTCPVPVIQNTLIAWVGVFAGTVDDGTLSTSTPALVKCVPCVTDGDNIPMAPPDDVYNQIIALIESGMLVGPPGPQGPQGQAGSILFKPVMELPTENIDETVIYLVPIEGSEGENRFTEYVYINGQWETLGAITVNVDHSEFVKKTDYATADKAGLVSVNDYHGLHVNNETGALSILRAEQYSISEKKNGYQPLTPRFLDYAVKVGVTTNTETLTDDEKASACEWLGAVPKWATDSRGYTNVLALLANGTYVPVILAYGTPTNSAIACYVGRDVGNNVLGTGTPVNPTDCANKEYVENLPTYFTDTITEEQQAKWRGMIGAKEIVVVDIEKMLAEQDVERFIELKDKACAGEIVLFGQYLGMSVPITVTSMGIMQALFVDGGYFNVATVREFDSDGHTGLTFDVYQLDISNLRV